MVMPETYSNLPPGASGIHTLMLFTESDSPKSWRSSKPFSQRADLVSRVFRSALKRGIFKHFFIVFQEELYRCKFPPLEKYLWLYYSQEGDVISYLKKVLRRSSFDELPKNLFCWLHEDGLYLSDGFDAAAPETTTEAITYALGGKDDPEESHPDIVAQLAERYPNATKVSLGLKSMLASEVVLRLPYHANIADDKPLPGPAEVPTLFIVTPHVAVPHNEQEFFLTGLNALCLYATQCGHGRNENVAVYINCKGMPRPLLLLKKNLENISGT